MDVIPFMRRSKLTRRTARLPAAWPATAFTVAALIVMSGCAEQITKHGHIFRESDIQQIQTGMSQDQVRMVMGTPTTTTTSGSGNVYYYISSTTKQSSFLLPKETDRQVAAVYFDANGGVERVANYGLKDGKVFDFISATTPAPGARDEGLLKQLFRNLGQKQIFGE
jgi:outer membrane protein assembly factor BamE (lipoprotein component of BamABCDE complex)